ncbi:hypothetical protein A5789_20895 [Nocardia sp. 852002-51101_SCH5132738]|nr:hypothetical protein A5789_20895 [Nocardia sp. 852002-51101_SCH5132738]OBB49750.1 hypothetical protein A5748_19475 [Nocardia sp. 852002-51244_SCH5132740]OBF64134.1 hypothetical protein A9X06_09105 [Mycobacterium sp. 852002-51759_SCH5129042]
MVEERSNHRDGGHPPFDRRRVGTAVSNDDVGGEHFVEAAPISVVECVSVSIHYIGNSVGFSCHRPTIPVGRHEKYMAAS